MIIDHGKIVASGTVRACSRQKLRRPRVLVILQGVAVDAPVPAGMTADDERRQLRAKVEDVARDVPGLLADLARTGAAIQDIELTGASLQDAFIALTGRELRE